MQQCLECFSMARTTTHPFLLRPLSKPIVKAETEDRSVVRPVAMRAVLQRVKSAKVEVDGSVVSAIGPGLLCLIGLKSTDTMIDAEFISRKILGTRLWPNPEGRQWQLDVRKQGYEILMVSQFTLYGRLKGTKPDFSQSMPTQPAKEMYGELVDLMQKSYHAYAVKDGIFGAMMTVSLENDGPVTLVVDSTKGSKSSAPNHSDTEEELPDEVVETLMQN